MDRPDVLLIISSFYLNERYYMGSSQRIALELRDAGFRVYTTSARRGRMGRLLDILRTIWRLRHTYEVAHIDTFGGLAFMWAALSAALLRHLKKPYVLTLHGGSLPNMTVYFPGLMRRLLLGASYITAPSEFMRDQFSPIRSDIEVVSNPLHLDRYPYRERTDIEPRMVWLRAFHHIYDPITAIRAMADLVEDVPDATLTMIGPDKGDGSLQDVRWLISNLNLNDCIDIIEGISNDEVGEYLSKFDIFINTSRVDHAPVSVTEALACGLCVVSTSVGAIPEMLSIPKAGLTVPPDDSAALANAVRHLLNNPSVAYELSRNAGRAAGTYDSRPILQRWGTIFREIAATG